MPSAPLHTFGGKHVAHSVYIYTDGACYPNPGPGGWGYVAVVGRLLRQLPRTLGEDYGHKMPTTNNEMELTAILEAIKALPALTAGVEHRAPIHVVSDSRYAIRCITEWGPQWKLNGWKKLNGDADICNLAVTQEIMMRIQLDQLPLNFMWVRGHKGMLYNERADALAGQGRARAKSEHIAATTHGAEL